MQNGVAIGALIATCFGLGWAIAGIQGVPSPRRLSLVGIAIVISLLIVTGIVWQLRSNPPLPSRAASFDGAIYCPAVAFETVAILAAVFPLRRKGLKDHIMPAVAIIVGAHFFGLAHAMIGAGRRFIWVGGIICLLAMAIIFGLERSFISSVQSAALTGFGCASILWISALWTLI